MKTIWELENYLKTRNGSMNIKAHNDGKKFSVSVDGYQGVGSTLENAIGFALEEKQKRENAPPTKPKNAAYFGNTTVATASSVVRSACGVCGGGGGISYSSGSFPSPCSRCNPAGTLVVKP